MRVCIAVSSAAFGVVRAVDFGHANRYIVISHGHSRLQFLNDISFLMLIYILYIFFGEVFVQIFCPFFN